MNHDRALVLKAFHPQFLLLTPACFVLGWALGVASGSGVGYPQIILAFIGALAAHVSVNGFNEYFDYRSGLDERTNKTPFSGGSGVLQARPDLAPWVLVFSGMAFGITLMAGAVFVWEAYNIFLLSAGLLGLFLVVAYTPWLTKNPFFCLIAPGLGFGILMVGGVSFVISGQISNATWIGALITFFVVNNLLLLNQYPDVEADRTVGRAHFPLVYGFGKSTIVYGIFSSAAYGLLLFALILGVFPLWTVLGCLPLLCLPWVLKGALRYASSSYPQQDILFLGFNVFVAVGTPFLIALGFWFEKGGF
jgi:1,4-dihydroxy-2-naphthoate octaprenyltransferase